MFDHIGLKVSDLSASVSFYREALAALGLELASSGAGYAGFGLPSEPGLWLYEHEGPLGPGSHVALRAPDRSAVQGFHSAGIAAGGRDNGAPGLRPDYSADYYAAFLLDPDGNNIEAVCFK
jgi:catechol 2,3-dioxygenase-like lactoylglutathione lyase family enzyme